jgi:hypothetical protein
MPRVTKAYVYTIVVDGTVRYIGKGTEACLFTHVIYRCTMWWKCRPAKSADCSRRTLTLCVGAMMAHSKSIERLNSPQAIPSLRCRK